MQPVVVVTGGNRGIGYEIARGCVRAGFRVVLTARDASLGRQAALELGCDTAQLDMDDPASIAACANEVRRRYNGIDALINNASMAHKHADPTPWTKKTRTTVMTNLFGTLAVCEAFFPLLKAGARVVTVASSAGHVSVVPTEALRREFASADSTLTVQRLAQLMAQFVADVEECKSSANAPSADWPHVAKGWPNSAYGMSKLAQIALAKIHARELSGRGISVNCCCPGNVATGMNPRGARTATEGADTAVWLACQPAIAATAQFFKDRTPVRW